MSTKLTRFFASRWGIIGVGAAIGLLAPLLVKLGNPPNMGICVPASSGTLPGHWAFTVPRWCSTSGPRSSALYWGR